MFTSVIGALTSLLPKYFIFGSYVPVLIFSFVNLGMVYVFSAWSRSGIEFWLGKSASLTLAVAFVATVAVAYVLAAINDSLREFLEGKHIWPPGLERAMCDEQRRYRGKLEARYATARRQRHLLTGTIERRERELRDALPRAAGAPLPSAGKSDSLVELRALVAAGALGKNLRTALPGAAFKKLLLVIETAFTAVIATIGAHHAPLPDDVEADRSDLLLLVGAIHNSLSQAEHETGTELFMRFGNDPVLPTRMGNIAAAIHAYSIGRYKMELTVFFSRLQTILVRKADKGYPVVLDAKAQLDFLVACCWLSALTAAIWTTGLSIWGGSPGAYIAVACVGLAVTSAFYLGAAQNYLSYAEVVRASIDVNRFTLLRELDVRLPNSLREERMLWATMNQLAFSGGDSVEFSYEHPKK